MTELFSGGLDEDGAEFELGFVVPNKLWADGRAGSGFTSFWIFEELLPVATLFFLSKMIVSIS